MKAEPTEVEQKTFLLIPSNDFLMNYLRIIVHQFSNTSSYYRASTKTYTCTGRKGEDNTSMVIFCYSNVHVQQTEEKGAS